MESAGEAGNRRTVWAYRLVVLALLAGVVLPVVTRTTGDWEASYTTAATRLRTGGELHGWMWPYTYPPFGALAAVPFSYLPKIPFRVAWATVNVAATLAFLALAWRVAGGRGLPGRPGTGPVDHAAFWLGLLLAVGFVTDAAANWQTDLLVGAVLVAGVALLARGRGIAAGAAFGTAAAFKCTPLLFAPYLLWKRRFVAAAAVPVVAVGLSLLPDAIYPPPNGKPRLVVWKERFLDPMAGAQYDPGTWASAVEYNHSLTGVTRRWLAFQQVQVDGRTTAAPRPDRPSTAELKRLNLALMAGLCLVALAAVWRRATNPRTELLAAEAGIVFALMLLFSPMSSKAHFCVLLVPQLALVRIGWANRDRFLLALAVLVGVGGFCTGKDVSGRRGYEFLLWHGLVFWLTVALFAGCCYARWRYGRAEVATAAEPEPAPEPRLAA